MKTKTAIVVAMVGALVLISGAIVHAQQRTPFRRSTDGPSAPAPVPLTLGDYTYTTNAAGQATITRFNPNYTGALVITNSLCGYPVTSLGVDAFAFCHGLTNIAIPTSVTSIELEAFYNCTNLPAAIQNLAPKRPTITGRIPFRRAN